MGLPPPLGGPPVDHRTASLTRVFSRILPVGCLKIFTFYRCFCEGTIRELLKGKTKGFVTLELLGWPYTVFGKALELLDNYFSPKALFLVFKFSQHKYIFEKSSCMEFHCIVRWHLAYQNAPNKSIFFATYSIQRVYITYCNVGYIWGVKHPCVFWLTFSSSCHWLWILDTTSQLLMRHCFPKFFNMYVHFWNNVWFSRLWRPNWIVSVCYPKQLVGQKI